MNNDLISRQAAIEAIEEMQMPIMRSQIENEQFVFKGMGEALQAIKDLPSAQERKKDIIQKFHDYQIEWLKSHYDIVLEPQLEELIVRFLHDTANSYMMEEQ